MFPNTFPKGAVLENYDYYYQCAFFGDPSFCIEAGFAFSNKSDLDNEKERIQTSATHSIVNEEVTLFFNSTGNIDYYLDEIVLDGYYYEFDIAIVKKDEKITYCYVYWQDNNGPNEFIDMIIRAYPG